jgi:hypothetical protein
MIIDIPKGEVWLLIYALRPHAFKDESKNIQEAAKKMRDMVDKIWIDVITPESKDSIAETKEVE